MAENGKRSGLVTGVHGCFSLSPGVKILREMLGRTNTPSTKRGLWGYTVWACCISIKESISKNIPYRLGATSKLRSIAAFITCSLRCWTALSVSSPAQASAKRRHPLNCTSQWLHLGDTGSQKLIRCLIRTLRIALKQPIWWQSKIGTSIL